MNDVLDFEVLDHEYKINGRTLPSVTQVINSQFPLVGIPAAALEFARQMGVAIHSACELYDKGMLDWQTLDPKVVGYVKAWQLVRSQLGLKIVEVESTTHHRLLFYAGRVDRIIEINGDLAVLDLKRPILNSRVGVQTAGYMSAINSHREYRRIKRRFGVQLRSDATYRWREYKDAEDWTIFSSALNIYNWRKRHDI